MATTRSRRDSATRVLVADDEQLLLESYTAILGREYDVRTATTGAEVLEKLDGSIDVAILDRRMPESTGDEALQGVRSRVPDCRVVLCSGVEPDFDIVAMDFDEYLVKPVGKEDVLRAVERQLALADYGPDVREYYALKAKRRVLDKRNSKAALSSDTEYERLTERLTTLEQSVTVPDITFKLPA